jgi:hypothetical protein
MATQEASPTCALDTGELRPSEKFAPVASPSWERKRQAVILIHGIGEQVPMETLRSFVDTVWTTDPSLRYPKRPEHAWSKPDRMSKNYELRRLTTAKDKRGYRTDFFELYWADLMQDTKISHLLAWARVLLLRSPSRIPSQLQGIWWFLWIVGLLLVAGFFLVRLDVFSQFKWFGAWIGVIGTILWFFVGGFLINIAGDAARYLHIAPANIASRRNIRTAGIDLLRELHKSELYSRIVVVGHSLGTVIGYDILTSLWSEFNEGHAPSAPRSPSSVLEKIEALAENAPRDSGYSKRCISCQKEWACKFQEMQAQYFEEISRQGNRWLVTDFVTLGSPLTHAGLLLARDDNQFERKKVDRELPTCPPELERIRGRERFTFKPMNRGWIPHHAAVFGVTRWTNLFFRAQGAFRGDVIGGPVAPAFGAGVHDIELQTNIRRGLFSHTLYWTIPSDEETSPPHHIVELRRAVRL